MSTTPFSQASWISAPCVGSLHSSAPVPFFRKAFVLDRPILSARLLITALGLYQCEINGRRVGDQEFAPGWTDYHKRVQYQSYDIAPFLHVGQNVIGVMLGDGWYCGYIGWIDRQVYGDRPFLLAQWEIVYEDGSKKIFGTDATWKTSTGPIFASDLLQGEIYDARYELKGWSEHGYDESLWHDVRLILPDPLPILAPSEGPPVRRHQELSPTKKEDLGWPLGYRFDLGQNFCGRIRLKIKAPAGTSLTIRHAEMLNPDGSLYLENLRKAKATDHYTCRGDDLEVWEPQFTFHGFRYVEIVGGFNADSQAPESVDITGVVLHSDIAPTGSFACSNPLLNQLQQNIIWGQKSNFLDVPMDCPQRSERLGWTGDAQVFIRTAAFNFDVRKFFHKWLRDLSDAQSERGGVPAVVPEKRLVKLEDGGPAWSDAAVICPWTIYICYGDRTILENQYESMSRYIEFVAKYRCKNHIRSHPEVDPWGGYGDWLALDGVFKNKGSTPHDLIGTAFYAYDANIMAKTAQLLEREEDATHYRELHRAIVKAFQHRFVTPEGLLASGTQTAYVLALYFDLLPKNVQPIAAEQLARDIRSRDCHLATGFVGTPYLLDVLETHGYLDLAYRLLEQETYPSWLFPVKNGATTIWERWDGWTPEKGFQDKSMNSFNHYAYGAVGAWMVRSVAGLELDPDDPGYRHVIFRPRPGGSLSWAEAELDTPQGKTSIRWDISGADLNIKLNVPANSRATFLPPIGYPQEAMKLQPGLHHFTLER